MKTLFFGAGPLGSVYAHLMHRSGVDVTVLERGERLRSIETHRISLVNEITNERDVSPVSVTKELNADDEYDLVIVLIRKNNLRPVFEMLGSASAVKHILFMGNNALGFDDYLQHLPAEKMLFGFPGAGGGLVDHVVHYADREKPNDKRRAVTIGEIDGRISKRTTEIKSLFKSAGIPVTLTSDINGWLKYHAALVLPLVCALYKHDCDNHEAAKDRGTLRSVVRAVKEGGRVVRSLGYHKRQPFKFNLFYWMPEFVSMMGLKQLLASKFAEIAFAMHAQAARDEMRSLTREFEELISRTAIETPNIDSLRAFIP